MLYVKIKKLAQTGYFFAALAARAGVPTPGTPIAHEFATGNPYTPRAFFLSKKENTLA